jgi:hypothetical protein
MHTRSITRTDWDSVRSAFAEFFAGRGDVEVDSDRASFRAAITGFMIAADGTSESFMPLHSIALGWDEVEFDPDAHEVRLRGPGGAYTYVVPHDLR